MNDFDFLVGKWRVHNRKLRERLKGSSEWIEFEATHEMQKTLDGLGNQDVFHSDHDGFTGMSFRFFNPATKQWAIYWADNRRGTLDPPVYGTFKNNIGTFGGIDTHEGRQILIRFLWTRIDTPAPRWEQAFSEDGGQTWETNWVMDFFR